MPAHSDIPSAVARLRAGGLVAFPTETVYGLGADALNAHAVARVFDIKGRPPHNPLIVHVSSQEMARRIAADWSEDVSTLARAFWPGPLTIVVRKRETVPDLVTAGGPSVAIRCPDHPLALALIDAFAGPLVGPSANRSGAVSPTTAQHVRESFDADDVLVLDGGPCRVGIESTVVSLTEGSARVLRPGVITPEDIARALGRPATRETAPAARPASPPRALESPGQLEQHYAPQTPAVLCDPSDLHDVLDEVEGRAVVLAPLLTRVPMPHLHMPMPVGAREYAARLYAALREADAQLASLIVVLRPGTTADPHDAGVWAAVLDRLSRACESR